MRNIDGCHRRAWGTDSGAARGRPLIVPKVAYRTEADALRVAAPLGQRAYHCSRCGNWHNTARSA